MKSPLCEEYTEFVIFSLDVDECRSGVCGQQVCKNTLGGYVCGCNKGYTQQADGSCQGKCTEEKFYLFVIQIAVRYRLPTRK